MQVSNKSNPQSPSTNESRLGSIQGLTLIGVVVSALFAACFVVVTTTAPPSNTGRSETASPSVGEAKPELFPIVIRQPAGPPQCDTGLVDNQGQPMMVACSTCHANRKPNFENKSVAELNEFHGNLQFSHGTVSCLSCHNPNDYDALKLADGTRVEYSDVMTLCAQCHGPQMNDYLHGAHGGMNGYWDRTRGPQTKNNCVDCHNPHVPQFPKMKPTFKPRDRFLEKEIH